VPHGAGGEKARANCAGYTYASPQLGNHLAHSPAYFGGAAATTAYGEGAPFSHPVPRAIVMCPVCSAQLYAPHGAPLFACPCGQLLQPPPQGAGIGAGAGGFPGAEDAWRYAEGGNGARAMQRRAAVLPPDPPDSIFELPGYGGARGAGGAWVPSSLSPFWTVPVPHIACPRCANLIAGTADMMICHVCGLRMSGVLTGRPVPMPSPPLRGRTWWERFWDGN
jgi:hypothetical protein